MESRKVGGSAEKLEGQELILDIFNSCGARNEFLISEI